MEDGGWDDAEENGEEQLKGTVNIQEGFLTEISLADSVGTLALGWADVSQLHCSTLLLAVVLDFVASLLLQQICVCTRTNGW